MDREIEMVKLQIAAQHYESSYQTSLNVGLGFMLAARARGLGTTFTSFHLFFEEDAAKLLGIPFEAVMQTALIPVAYERREVQAWTP